MKKHWFHLLVLFCLLFAGGCQSAPTAVQPASTVQPTPTIRPDPTATPVEEAKPTPGEVVLTITGLNGETNDFTLADIKNLPAVEGQAGIKSSTGKITPPLLFKGVLLADLLNRVGEAGSVGIQIEAKDGYAMTFSSDQVTAGDFIAYDPATGDEIDDAGKLQVLIAYEMDGKPLDVERDGFLRLVVISEKNNQVTDGHWSIKWVRRITVKTLAEEWALAVEGGITDSVDRGSFESCSTGACHQATWKDDKAQTWSGTPLWWMVGRMDDEIKHGDDAFNEALAAQGYTVEVIGKDGYSAIFDIARLVGNTDIIVANQVNGNPLTDADFPLRLVGGDVGKKEGVGGIEKIVIHFDQQAVAAPTEAPTAAPVSSGPPVLPEGKALMMTGLVEKEQAWTLDELKKLEVIKLTVEHPKKGSQEVEGVRLNDLINLAELKPGAATIIFTAADGFTATASLADIQACSDCLVAFNQEGGLKLAMPGMDSGLWVKDIIAITIQ